MNLMILICVGLNEQVLSAYKVRWVSFSLRSPLPACGIGGRRPEPIHFGVNSNVGNVISSILTYIPIRCSLSDL